MSCGEGHVVVESVSEDARRALIDFEKLEACMFIQKSKIDIEDPENESSGRLVLNCIREALKVHISVPDWLFNNYCQRLDAINESRAKKWSDKRAFGREHPKGQQVAKAKNQMAIGELTLCVNIR